MSPITIEKQKLVLVEGMHEKTCFDCLLKEEGINDIQVEQVNGKDNFLPVVSFIRSDPNFVNLVSLALIRDADDCYDNAFKSLQGALKNANLEVPATPNTQTNGIPKTSIFVFPDNCNPGSLETIFLYSVSTDPVFPCVDAYFECLEQIQNRSHKHIFKAKTQVYLASKAEGDIHLARAAQKNYISWVSPVFNDIKSFFRAQ